MESSALDSESPPPPAVVDDAASHEIFPFMKLPAEMRLHIYRMCLKRERPILLHVPRPPTTKQDDDEAATTETDDSLHTNPSSSSGPPSSSLRLSRNHSNNTNRHHTSNKHLNPSANTLVSFGAAARDAASSSSSTTWSDLCTPTSDINTSPLAISILRLSKQIYREARPVLYADNEFAVRLDSALPTLTTLHQRSRSMIKQVHITIHSHHDILEGFADLVRLGLRYCWGLEVLHLKLTTAFPEDSGSVRGSSVYANAFHILRWLPKSCKVRLEGKVPGEVERIIRENERNAEVLDDKAYQRRQHQMPEKRPSSSPMERTG